jgi:hypothetical protein
MPLSALFFCHHEATFVAEGSAVQTFSPTLHPATEKRASATIPPRIPAPPPVIQHPSLKFTEESFHDKSAL